MHDLADDKRKSIEKWNSSQDITNAGMLVQIKRKGQASIRYDGDCVHFRIRPDSASSQYVASRISEIDTRLEVEQRVKSWYPIEGKTVKGEFRVRFSHEQTALTYNLMMWNAPFSRETIMPAMSIGVTRSAATDFEYAAVIAQNIVVNPQMGSSDGDVLLLIKLQEAVNWLRMTEWHTVHIMYAEDQARVSVQQGFKQEAVAETRLVKPVEALGFVFSVDNEVFPGRYMPVSGQASEGFDMAYFEAGYSV